jgi:hypothetical protein
VTIRVALNFGFTLCHFTDGDPFLWNMAEFLPATHSQFRAFRQQSIALVRLN